jgi:hypothetical protein
MDCLVINASATGLLLELPPGRSCHRGSRHTVNLDGLELPVVVARIELNPGRLEGHALGLEIDIDRADCDSLREFSQWILSGMDCARIEPAGTDSVTA